MVILREVNIGLKWSRWHIAISDWIYCILCVFRTESLSASLFWDNGTRKLSYDRTGRGPLFLRCIYRSYELACASGHRPVTSPVTSPSTPLRDGVPAIGTSRWSDGLKEIDQVHGKHVIDIKVRKRRSSAKCFNVLGQNDTINQLESGGSSETFQSIGSYISFNFPCRHKLSDRVFNLWMTLS
jgi:hypothetical protein